MWTGGYCARVLSEGRGPWPGRPIMFPGPEASSPRPHPLRQRTPGAWGLRRLRCVLTEGMELGPVAFHVCLPEGKGFQEGPKGTPRHLEARVGGLKDSPWGLRCREQGCEVAWLGAPLGCAFPEGPREYRSHHLGAGEWTCRVRRVSPGTVCGGQWEGCALLDLAGGRVGAGDGGQGSRVSGLPPPLPEGWPRPLPTRPLPTLRLLSRSTGNNHP